MAGWKAAVRRASTEALKAAGIETTERMVVLVISQAVMAAALFFVIKDTAFGDALWTRILTAALPFLLLPVLFVWKWISMGPRLLAASDSSEAMRAARNELAEKFAGGSNLFVAPVKTDEDLAQWTEAYAGWLRAVVTLLEKSLSPADRHTFEHDHGGVSLTYDHKFNAQHDRLLNTFASRLRRLRSIIDRMPMN